MTDQRMQSSNDTGFSAVEIMIAMAVLSIGLMGFIGVLSSAQVLARGSKEFNAANNAIISAVEVFREECRIDFEAALTKYNPGLVESASADVGADATISRSVILDENAITSPPIDINGNGNQVDVVTDLSTVRVAVFRIRLSWQSASGTRTLEQIALLARGELQ